MIKISIVVSQEDLEKIKSLITQGRYKNRSDFIRQAISTLLGYLHEHAEPTLGFDEDDQG